MSHATPEQDAFLRAFAGKLARRGLRVPALVMLAAGRPLTFVLGQILWVAQPAASLFWTRAEVATLATVLEDELAVTRLQEYLSRED